MSIDANKKGGEKYEFVRRINEVDTKMDGIKQPRIGAM